MENEILLEDLKRKLNITWEDEDTNFRLVEIIEDAKIILNHKLGGSIDYSQNGIEHSLFLNYCMYSWNNCTNEFDKNYMNEIYQVRAINEVKHYEETEI